MGALLPLDYAARSVLRRPWRSLILMVSQAVSSGLVVLILLALYATNGYLSGTLLGEYIQQRIEGYHYLVAVLSFVLAALGLRLPATLPAAKVTVGTRKKINHARKTLEK